MYLYVCMYIMCMYERTYVHILDSSKFAIISNPVKTHTHISVSVHNCEDTECD